MCVCHSHLLLYFILLYLILFCVVTTIIINISITIFNFFFRGPVTLPSCNFFLLVVNCSLQFYLVCSLKAKLYIRKLTLVADTASPPPSPFGMITEHTQLEGMWKEAAFAKFEAQNSP